MAKGRTSQPILIVVADQWVRHPAVQELRAVGHTVQTLDELYTVPREKHAEPDAILHPAAHGWHEAMFEQFTRKNGEAYRPFLDAAVKAGRQRRKGR